MTTPNHPPQITHWAGPDYGPYGRAKLTTIERRIRRDGGIHDRFAELAEAWCKERGLTSDKWRGPNGLAPFARSLPRPAPWTDDDVRRVAEKWAVQHFGVNHDRARCCRAFIAAIQELTQCSQDSGGGSGAASSKGTGASTPASPTATSSGTATSSDHARGAASPDPAWLSAEAFAAWYHHWSLKDLVGGRDCATVAWLRDHGWGAAADALEGASR